jgi:DNA mismatch endonuclease (patch repair protein)
MPDVFTTAKRSEVMSRIRGRGNRETELVLVAIFRRQGISGWRRNWPVFGRPDFVFPRERVAVFVDGCFWHGCPRHYNVPANNAAFWRRKRLVNRRRDRQVDRTLRKSGWRVVRIWEHALRDESRVATRVRRVLEGERSKIRG